MPRREKTARIRFLSLSALGRRSRPPAPLGGVLILLFVGRVRQFALPPRGFAVNRPVACPEEGRALLLRMCPALPRCSRHDAAANGAEDRPIAQAGTQAPAAGVADSFEEVLQVVTRLRVTRSQPERRFVLGDGLKDFTSQPHCLGPVIARFRKGRIQRMGQGAALPHPYVTMPRRTALRTSSAVLCRSSFSMMRQRWVSTVCRLRLRRRAISLLLLPSARS